MAARIEITSPEEVGKEITDNINQSDGLLLVSNTKVGNEDYIRIETNNETRIIEGLYRHATTSISPAPTLQFLNKAIQLLKIARHDIECHIERVQKDN